MDPASKAKKTRYRVPTVCTVCRRRKMKCDKAKPHCSSCVKNNTTNLCSYEEQPWAASNEQQKLKDQIFQLQQQNNELKKLLSFNVKNSQSFSSSTSSGSFMDSPFSANFNFILPDQPINDPVMELTEDFDVLMLKENKMAHYGSTSYMAAVSRDPILRGVMKNYMDQQKLGVNFDKFFLYDQKRPLHADENCTIVGKTVTDGTSVFESDVRKNHQELIDSINGILPSIHVIRILIDYFFTETYVFIPFVDEVSFRKNVDDLLVVDENGKAKIQMENFLLLTTVAVLLCVLRLAFISLPVHKQDAKPSSAGEKVLKSGVHIGPSYIEYAKACMGNASVMRKPTLKHINALLILRLYRYYAPEDGDEGTDSTILLSLIVQMAKVHGLHRDATRFSMISSHATINMWRKIWAQLMYLDALQALAFGCPLLIDDEYDTLLPSANFNDSPLEKSCIDNIKKQHEVTLAIRDIIQSCSKIKVHPKRSELEMKVKNIEFLLMKYRTIKELCTFDDPNDDFITKTIKVRDLVNKVMLLNVHYITYYILLLSCEEGEIAMIQRFSNATSESALTLFKLVHDYAQNPTKFNHPLNFESFFSATLFDISKRTLQAICSLCVRDLSNLFNFQISVQHYQLPDSKDLVHWLEPLSTSITVGEQLLFRVEEFTQFCGKLSKKYFVCWRITFMQKMVHDYLEYQHPGRIAEVNNKVKKAYETLNTDLDIELGLTTSNDASAGAYWNQFTDSANQSQFDYLAPDLNKYDGIDDPFMSDALFSGELNFQDFDYLMSDLNGVASKSTNSVHTDEVSPQSITSDPADKMKDDINSNYPGNDLLHETDGILKNVVPELNDHDLAMQVARSMFGGSGSNNQQWL
ncbi:hypothetical protein BN7_3508 [Wickerhamomyces ciferrii]|uniref:Zn(2)-C6 fungal-type domain-containing protein n=1 Tax=Wickerhamomyces ciferrii (strain ATCC 14091 / BCRC 22168 / CBS 111 / JCM 3599 / NBRC 0793 / NRRL Y-1031 F-60-10) TaxID=1206466 RepID=K0KRK0_WICCF|nr:uncharacterized protein BN7_3508 [Wickerhamomyces ciferrii]CCH43953.1 hypothetical protein BN7_3508 [Wickerhamomyces ciferrii]